MLSYAGVAAPSMVPPTTGRVGGQCGRAGWSAVLASSRPFMRVERVNGVRKPSYLEGPPRTLLPRGPAGRRWVSPSVATTDGVATGTETDESAEAPFDWYNQWYAVKNASLLSKTLPNRIQLMGDAAVVWWDPAAEKWAAARDACPHRCVPLSEGRVNERGALECGYHGWEFEGSGACTAIPQGGKKDTDRACLETWPCAVRQGLLFVKPLALVRNADGSISDDPINAEIADESDIPVVPQLDEEGWTGAESFRDVPYDWSTLMENLLDVAHVPFTHHKTISDRSRVIEMFDLYLKEPVTPHGFVGEWPTGAGGGTIGPQTTNFKPPCLMYHFLDGKDTKGYEAMTIVYATPIAPGKARLISRTPIKFIKNPLVGKIFKILPTWFQHVGQLTPLEDDQIFLHLGEETFTKRRDRGQPISKVFYSPNKQDAFVNALWQWIDSHGGGGPFGPQTRSWLASAGPRQSRLQLLDRYAQHTEDCPACSAAMHNFERAATVMSVASVLSLAGAAFFAGKGAAASPVGLSVGAAAVFAVISNACNVQAGKFRSGSWPAPRNLPGNEK